MKSIMTKDLLTVNKVVSDLNSEWYEFTNDDDSPFLLYSDSNSHSIIFYGMNCIWNSEYDDLDFEGNDNDIVKLRKFVIGELTTLSNNLSIYLKEEKKWKWNSSLKK